MKQTVIKNPGWWSRRSGMERSLLYVTMASTLAIIALVATLSWCVVSHRLAPASVIQAMDTKVEPCDDFYAYACGEYLRKTSIPDDKTSVNIFTQINDQLQQQLRTIIEEPLMETDNRPVKLLKGVYAACMNKTLIEDRGLEPVKRILRELHGWPVLDGDKWDPSKFDWKQYVYRLREIGQSVDFFIDFSVGTDAKNSTYRTINLDTASLGLSREYLVKGMDDKLVKAYYDYQVDIAVLYGADRERAKKELRESLDFEIALANISLPSEKRRNVTLLYNPMTIEEMQTEFPSIPWIEYINRILPNDVQVTKDEIIVVSVPGYIKQLESLLSTTEKRVQANYALWRIAGGLVSYLTQELRDRQLKYSTTLTGKLQEDPRWKMCTDLVANGVSLSLGSLYVTKFFNEDSKKAAMEMVTDIRQTFQQMLLKVDWMDEKTKQRALDKAKSMSVHIAYPDELLDLSKLEKFYANLEISPQLYLESILNLTKFGADYSFGRLRLPVNKTEWITHGRPAVVNAYYSSIENSIQFPAGILQGNFFSSERPKYMNYGAIGFVIGHEITHGFDDQGRQFDKNGNLIDWWEPETKEKFLAKATCIINQYGNFTDKSTGLHLNGINTQGENIADNGGIKEAYLAYTAWSDRQKQPEPRLPGLASLSPRQMFWVSAAQTWCTKHRPEAMRQRITTGVHSPGEFRVLGPLSNMPDFAKDFRCPSGSKMNPISKCQVW